jgi:3-deoxy-manno-octulosonate cytidylyltransferase (CMP-KDO synthetase)
VYRIVIPARFDSTRFPGKPLALLANRPLIAWVVERARNTRAAEVIVATDHGGIAGAARAAGADVAMTAASHVSGTDRVAEVARARGFAPTDLIVNLQGDEPGMPALVVDQVAEALAARDDADLATAAVPIATAAEYRDPNCVKVVTDARGRALYFSRASIPLARDAGGAVPPGARRHVGLYAYRVGALLRLADLPPSPLELTEKLEQLRALDNGLTILVVDALERPAGDVNTPEDLARLAAAMAESPERRGA